MSTPAATPSTATSEAIAREAILKSLQKTKSRVLAAEVFAIALNNNKRLYFAQLQAALLALIKTGQVRLDDKLHLIRK